MISPLDKVSGFFRIEVHSSAGRALWTFVAVCCISLVLATILALRINFFDPGLGRATPFSRLLPIVGVALILSGFTFVIALPKSLKSSGRYLHGVRVTAHGLEKGALELALTPAYPSTDRALANPRQQATGQWRTREIIIERFFEVLVSLRLQGKAAGTVRFECLNILVNGKPIQRLFGRAGNENCWQDLAILDRGAIHLIESRESMDCWQLLKMLETLARVLSVSTQAPSPACTLKLYLGHAGQHNPLATGILGAFPPSRCKPPTGATLANYFDEQDAWRLEKLLEENNWRYCFCE